MELPQLRSLLYLAASLGSEAALVQLPQSEQQTMDDGFRLFMSTADFLPDGFDYSPANIWPHTHEAALKMGLAAFQEYLPDWQAAFRTSRNLIPSNVDPGLPTTVINAVEGWLANPESFDCNRYGEIYEYLKVDICLNGYLTNDHPRIPKVISEWCMGAFMLIDSSNWRSVLDVRSHQVLDGPDAFEPQGITSANVPDGVRCLLGIELDDSRIRLAIQRKVIPWCLERSE